MSDLSRAWLAELDDDLRRLAERLTPYLLAAERPPMAAYTPATLARELGRSERSIRAAIARGELEAVKRGRWWLLSAEAVQAWVQGEPRRRSRSTGVARRALPG